ncbi:MAG: M23 family metallopeptidase [Bacteroidales bacterium]|nr:M23 family metallopeptidase [Bacteroidales bacterium]MCF8391019.1 M23 family metallopeptidase [Bacteroidales bacterium]
MKRVIFIFNQETLQFEKVQKSLRRKLRDGLIFTFILGSIFISTRIILDDKVISPKVNSFTVKNENLRVAYVTLNEEIINSEKKLAGIQLRDDKLYRSVLELEPIPSSVREAGFGGSEDYSENLNLRDAEFVTKTALKLDKLSNKAKIQSVSLNDLYTEAMNQQLFISHKPSIQPISPADKFWLTSTYGVRYDPFTKGRRMHQGIDLAGQVGLKIYASGDGIVQSAGYNFSGYGKEVTLDHGFGYESIYAHLNKILVSEGDTVRRGQLIGELGSTGRSTGPHLHYEIRFFGKTVNPMYYFYENISAKEYNLMIANVRN